MSHPCSHSDVIAIHAGWAMFTGWKMGASSRIYSMVSLPLGLGVEATCNYASRMYVSITWKHATLTLSHGKPLQMTEPCGSNKCQNDWKEERLPSKKIMVKDGPGEQSVISKTTKTCIKCLSSHARVSAETANPGLASTATQDDAHQQPLRVLLHSWLTDGCQ